MKIKSCHINGFGVYQNVDFNFEDLSQFVLDNGKGKSTLADFIKYMLYDMPKKDIRLKYAPFKEGAYGGSLILIYDDKEYRVEKEFDYKSATKDTEKVYLNNTLTDIKGLGNYLFKVDLEGFIRTIFINGNDLTIETNSTINSKLNSLVAKTDEDFDLNKVKNSLKDTKKLYGTSAKTTSLYLSAKKELEEKKDEMISLKNLEKALDLNYADLKIKEDELNSLNELLEAKEKENDKARIYETYKEKKNNILKLQNDADNIKNKYPKLLSNEEIKNIKNDINEYNRLNIKINKEDFNNPEALKLNELFINNPITEEDIKNIDSKINELEAKKLELKNKNQIIIKEEDVKRFDGFDVEKEIDDAKEALVDYNNLTDALLASKEVKVEKHFNLLYIPAIISFIILVLGIVLIVMDQLILGIILAIAGALASILFILFATKPKNKTYDNTNFILEHRKAEKRLTDILARYRYDDPDYSTKLSHLINDYEEYKKAIENNKLLDDANLKLEDDISNLKTEIEEFLNKYLPTYDEYHEALRTINIRLDRYNRFVNDKEQFEKNNVINKEKLTEIENKLNNISKEYNISLNELSSFLDDMNNDLGTLDFVNNNIEKNKIELNEFEKENEIDPNLEFELLDLTELKKEKEEKQKEFNTLNSKILDDEAQLERLPYLEGECVNLEEKIASYKHKAKIIDEVINSLDAADNSLKEKYIKPLKDKFVNYADDLNSIFKDHITFDKDFNLKLEREGKLFDDIHLSQGERTIAMLCYRLALIDNMYLDKPFIILDDPFVNLDSKNLNEALKLVKKLSKRSQIIYFTCIVGRKV